MKKVNLVLLVVVFFVLFSLTNVFAKDSSDEWTAQLRPGLRSGSGKTLFYTDYLTPLYGNEKSLVFLNLKAMVSNVHTDEENLGFGYRRLLDEKWILGANLFYDTRYSENSFRYYQLGCGLEALSKWIDFRANYYHPISGEKHIEGEDFYKFGERSLLKYENYEEALRGFDAEIGFLVPKISDFIETRIYGGGYWYNSKLGQDVKGTKAGIEIRPLPALMLNVEIKNDDVFGNDTFVKACVMLPFEIGNIFKGKSPFAGWKDSLKIGKEVRKLKERMTDMVVRDIDIITSENIKEKKLHDMIFVDNSNDGDEDGSLSHPHNTLDEAFNDDPLYGEGVWIYVKEGDGTATGYTGNYTLADSVTLWGEGYKYLGLGGDGYPVIDGGGTGNVISLGWNNTVMGCQIQNHGPEVSGGIYGNNPGTVSIIHNNISSENYNGDAYGIYLGSDGSANNITILGNSIGAVGSGEESTAYGIHLENSGSSTNAINISESTISATCSAIEAKAYGIHLENSGSSTNAINILENTIARIVTGPWNLSMPYGIYIRNSDDSVNTINIARNTMKGTIFGDFAYGIKVEGYDSSVNTISISENALSDFTAESAVGIYITGWNDSTNVATISENTISDFSRKFGMEGILVSGLDASTNTFTISENTISDFWNMTKGCGISVYTAGKDALDETENTVIISGNTITDFDTGNMYGINIEANDGSKDYITVSKNIIALATEFGTARGIYIDKKGGTIEVDIGGGSLGSEGYNSIYDNKNAAIEHNLGETVMANNNWWGSPEPDPTLFIGYVDYIPYLTSDPND